MSITAEITVRQRSDFAVQHMMAAARFSRLCHEVEKDNYGLSLGPFFDEIISYVTATILSSVASIESNINEIFADARDGILKLKPLDIKLLAEIWQLIEEKPILEKYQIMLVLNGKNRLEKGVYKYQNVDTLIKVRNAIVHFKPEWHDEQESHGKIGKRLQGKFDFSPFVDKNSPIFPTRAMTHGFTAWAVQSSLDFIQWYSEHANIPNRYVNFMDKINFAI